MQFSLLPYTWARPPSMLFPRHVLKHCRICLKSYWNVQLRIRNCFSTLSMQCDECCCSHLKKIHPDLQLLIKTTKNYLITRDKKNSTAKISWEKAITQFAKIYYILFKCVTCDTIVLISMLSWIDQQSCLLTRKYYRLIFYQYFFHILF